MTPSRARFIASSFEEDKGFKVAPFTRQLKVIEHSGKRSFFLKKKTLLGPPEIESLIAVFQINKTTHNKENQK